ncbi:Lysozyme RrrD [Escherichia coli]|nr:Lysozyme RrrD [Escherichia coli]
MKLILPFPPSVNTYWRHPNKGAFAGKSLISEAGRKFQSAACAAIVEQLRRLPKPTSAPASVEIVLFPPDTGNFRTSTLLRKINRDDIKGACDQLRRWTYAGGKQWKGLMTRREIEREVCLWGQK